MSTFLKLTGTSLTLALLLAATPGWSAQRTDSTPSPQASRPEQNSASARDNRVGGASQHSSRQQSAGTRAGARQFRNMSPQQQRSVRRAYRYYHSLPRSKRRALRQQWKQQEKQGRPAQTDSRRKGQNSGSGGQ